MSDDYFLLFYLTQLEARLMSALSDKIAETSAELDAAIGRVREDVSALESRIAELEKMVADGTATPDDIAALEQIRLKAAAIDPTSSVTLPGEGAQAAAPKARKVKPKSGF